MHAPQVSLEIGLEREADVGAEVAAELFPLGGDVALLHVTPEALLRFVSISHLKYLCNFKSIRNPELELD